MRAFIRYGLLFAGLCVAAPATPAFAQQAPSPQWTQAVRLRDAGDHAAAAAMFQSIAEQQPLNGRAWFNRAYCLHAAGDMAAAIEAHREVAERFPARRAVATYNLGCALAMTGDSDAALEALERAVRIGFRNTDQLASDAELESLRADQRFAEIVALAGELDANPPQQALRFWVGEWDCYTTTGTLSGHNTIALDNGGSVIHESWRPAAGTNGGVGQSWNYYDAAMGEWTQIWITDQGQITRYRGNWDKGVFTYEGASNTTPTGVVQRMTLTPLDGGRVRQHGTQTIDGGATWTKSYDLIYVPKGQPF